MRSTIHLFTLFLPTLTALKFLAYNPAFARSHLTFISSLSDALIDAGHQVHMLTPIIDSRLDVMGSTKSKIIMVPQSNSSRSFESEVESRMSRNLWLSESVADSMQEMKNLRDAWHGQCNFTMEYDGLMEELRSEQYDGALSEPICQCGLANMGYHNDKMNLFERIQNLANLFIPKMFLSGIRDPFNRMFRERFGDEFPKIEEISRNFVNAEPLIDFPKIITHKVIDIGGISVSAGYKSLNETWSTLLDRRTKNVLISFGTVAKSYTMPIQYKQSIIETAKNFTDVTFIWKYENPQDKISEGIENLVESTWLPQNDLLHDPRVSLFITHCGQGSTIEAVTAGVPLIVIPVLGDQQRNAQVENWKWNQTRQDVSC